MEIKESQSMQVLCFETKATLQKLQKYVGQKPDEIAAEITKQGLEATGPQYWIYNDVNGDPKKEFTLLITIPVNKTGKENGVLRFTKIPGFKHVSYTHHGAWSEFKQVYQKLITEIRQAGMQTTNQCREIYIHSDFEKPENCITEIQIGVM